MSEFERQAAEIAADHLDLVDNSIMDPAMREAVIRQMLMIVEARRQPSGTVARSPKVMLSFGFRLTGELQVMVEGKRGAESIGWILALDNRFSVGGRLLDVTRTCETLDEAVHVLISAYRLKPGGPI